VRKAKPRQHLIGLANKVRKIEYYFPIFITVMLLAIET